MQIVTVGGLFPTPAGAPPCSRSLDGPVRQLARGRLLPARAVGRPRSRHASKRARRKSFGLSFQEARREPTFWMLNIGFFLLGVTATSLVTQQAPLLQDAGWTPAETARLQTTFGFGLLFARVAVGYVIDHIFAPRVLTTVSIGGAFACILYALYPNVGYVSALLIGFLLGAEFDVLAFLIKRYYGNVAYGRLYGVIFGVFYLGSGIGIWGLPKIRELSGDTTTTTACTSPPSSWSLRRF